MHFGTCCTNIIMWNLTTHLKMPLCACVCMYGPAQRVISFRLIVFKNDLCALVCFTCSHRGCRRGCTQSSSLNEMLINRNLIGFKWPSLCLNKGWWMKLSYNACLTFIHILKSKDYPLPLSNLEHHSNTFFCCRVSLNVSALSIHVVLTRYRLSLHGSELLPRHALTRTSLKPLVKEEQGHTHEEAASTDTFRSASIMTVGKH